MNITTANVNWYMQKNQPDKMSVVKNKIKSLCQNAPH